MNLPHYHDRLYESHRQKRRYHTDPQFRLDRINRTRERLGLPPHSSIDEVPPRGHAARSQPRNAGRFV